MANPYPPNYGEGFPRAPQQGPMATAPALDALRRMVFDNASPAGGMKPNPNRLTESPSLWGYSKANTAVRGR